MEAPGSISPTRQIEQWRYSLTGSKDGGAPTPDGAAVSVIYSTPTVASSFGTSMTQPAAHKTSASTCPTAWCFWSSPLGTSTSTTQLVEHVLQDLRNQMSLGSCCQRLLRRRMLLL
ncbi:hypothetical protein BS78_07G110900 [Paspalum vaginatum]|nr:hypothetical protein BS78_07G110900 [Paspalum vaginatum]